MAISPIIQHNQANAGSVNLGHCSYSSNNAAGNILFCAVRYADPAQTVAFSDSAGNTWNPSPLNALGSSTGIWLGWAPNCVAGANTVNVTGSGVAASMRIAVAEYQGADSVAPFDVANTASGTGTAIALALTPTYPGELLIIVTGSAVASVPTGGSAQFTVEESVGSFLAFTDGFGANPAGLENGAVNIATSTNWLAIMAAFRAPIDTVSALLVPQTGFRLHEFQYLC